MEMLIWGNDGCGDAVIFVATMPRQGTRRRSRIEKIVAGKREARRRQIIAYRTPTQPKSMLNDLGNNGLGFCCVCWFIVMTIWKRKPSSSIDFFDSENIRKHESNLFHDLEIWWHVQPLYFQQFKASLSKTKVHHCSRLSMNILRDCNTKIKDGSWNTTYVCDKLDSNAENKRSSFNEKWASTVFP